MIKAFSIHNNKQKNGINLNYNWLDSWLESSRSYSYTHYKKYSLVGIFYSHINDKICISKKLTALSISRLIKVIVIRFK